MKNSGENCITGLEGKKILLGVTGSIAAYKSADWVRSLIKEEAMVTVMMTGAAERFISALSFAALSGQCVYRDMFDEDPEGVMAHINLSRDADVILVAPATAQTIARISHGMADDLISTVVLAARKPVIICPAMNSNMLENPATQQNLKRLVEYGYHVVDPDSGSLACGDVGDGRLPDWDVAREAVLRVLTPNDFLGCPVLITAGPTREALDPARYVSNRSSGKMGYALARAAHRRGATVTLISGPVDLPHPPGVEVIKVSSASEMYTAVFEHREEAEVIIKSAAVADFRPDSYQPHKIKKKSESLQLNFIKNKDILSALGQRRKQGQLLVGFAAESKDHEQEGERKLLEKNIDLIVVNDILGKKTGFDVDTNQVTLIDRQGSTKLPLLSKEQTANGILDKIVSLVGPKD